MSARAAIVVSGWPVLTLDEPPGLRPGMVLRLAKLFRQNAFDVVHTHDDKPLVYSALAVKMAGIGRFIHTQHHGVLPQVTRRQTLLVQVAGRFCDVFACVSHDSARDLVEHGFPPRRLLVLWNGIDLERFPWRGPNPAGPALTVARLSPEKDIATLLRAAHLLGPAAPAWRLQIAGAGPLDAQLRRLASDLGLDGCVRFLGEVRGVSELLCQGSLFILPSKTEGISLTVLEAMASGLPVIATKVGGNPEVVQDGLTGLLVPPGDHHSLAEAIARICADPKTLQQMGTAGRRRVKAHFDVRKMVARYESLYLGALPPVPSKKGKVAMTAANN